MANPVPAPDAAYQTFLDGCVAFGAVTVTAQRDQKDPRNQPKAGKPEDTGSSANGVPGAGSG
jgi:hypothetical protein